jgi:hypothetical protein
MGPIGPIGPCGPVGPVGPDKLVGLPVQTPDELMTAVEPTVRPFFIVKLFEFAIYYLYIY